MILGVKWLLLFLVLCNLQYCFSQENIISGYIYEESMQPLEFANIHIHYENSIDFTSSDSTGYYSTKLLNSNIKYISVSYLGYNTDTVFINVNESLKYNFNLKKITNLLGLVTIVETTKPIIIKKDTTVYNVDKFANGSERKLREILEHLPGLEVDRNGSVFFNGNKINKIMIEDKLFFNGNSKLAVNNIPAKVIKQIEILENFNEISFLKNTSDNNELVLNVKLKDNKSKFIFGDILLGIGHFKRYNLHPSVFFYSPKTNINIIGDMNNVGNSPLNFNDFIEMEGGKARLIENGGSIVKDILNNFAPILFEQDFNFKKSKFLGLNVSHDLSKNISLSGYTFLVNDEVFANTYSFQQYFIDTFSTFKQYTSSNNVLNKLNNFSKLNFNYKISNSENFKIEISNFKNTNKNTNHKDLTNNFAKNNIFDKKSNNYFSFNAKIDWVKKISNKAILNLNVVMLSNASKSLTDISSTQPIFQNLVDSTYYVSQLINLKSNIREITGEYTISLSSKNQFKLTSNFHSENKYFISNTLDSSNNLLTSNNISFMNYIDFKLVSNNIKIQNTYGGLENNIKVGLDLYSFKYSIENIQLEVIKSYLLPSLNLKFKINSLGKFDISYKMENSIPNVLLFSENFYFLDFNTVRKGSVNSENVLTHNYNFKFSRSNLFSNQSFFFNTSVYKIQRDIRYRSELFGLQNLQSAILVVNPNIQWNNNLSFIRKINSLFVNPKLQVNYSESRQFVGDLQINSKLYNINIGILLKYNKIKDNMKFEIGFNFKNNISKLNPNSSTIIKVYEPLLNVEFNFSKHLTLRYDGKFNFFRGSEASFLTTNMSNLSLNYNNSKSPLSFEFSFMNVFNANRRINNSISEFIFIEDITYIQPRVILLNFNYTL